MQPRFALAVALTLPGLARAAEPSAFRPVLEKATPDVLPGDQGAWSIGLGFSTVVPLSSPYKVSASGNSADFRLQIPASILVGLEYGISRDLDVGLWSGIEHYASRAPQKSVGLGGDDLQTVNIRAIPIEATARFRLNSSDRITPEFEGGLGYAFGHVDVSSTVINAAVSSTKLNYFKGHVAAGAAFGWDENTNLHASMGYGISLLGSATYPGDATNLASVEQSNLHGLFVKALVRHRF